MRCRVPDRFAEWLQCRRRFMRHHAQPRRELGVLDAVLLDFLVLEVGLRLGLLLGFKKLPLRSTSFAEADVISEMRSLWVMVVADFDLPPSPRDDRRAFVFVFHSFRVSLGVFS